VHNWLVALLDISPISAYSLAEGANHSAERGSTGELFRVPGVPIADGGDKAVKVNGVYGVSGKSVECCQQRD